MLALSLCNIKMCWSESFKCDKYAKKTKTGRGQKPFHGTVQSFVIYSFIHPSIRLCFHKAISPFSGIRSFVNLLFLHSHLSYYLCSKNGAQVSMTYSLACSKPVFFYVFFSARLLNMHGGSVYPNLPSLKPYVELKCNWMGPEKSISLSTGLLMPFCDMTTNIPLCSTA